MDRYLENIKNSESAKGKQVRALKIASNIKNLLNSKLLILIKNYKPQYNFVFTTVLVSKGFDQVSIYFSPVHFTELKIDVRNAQDQQIVNYLKEHKIYFKQQIATNLSLKYVPDLKFYPDFNLIAQYRLDRLLRNTEESSHE